MKNIMNVLKSEEFWKQGSENIWKNHKKSTTSSWFRYKFSRVVEATEALENIQKEEALSAQFRVPHAWRIDFMLILYTSYTHLIHILYTSYGIYDEPWDWGSPVGPVIYFTWVQTRAVDLVTFVSGMASQGPKYDALQYSSRPSRC